MAGVGVRDAPPPHGLRTVRTVLPHEGVAGRLLLLGALVNRGVLGASDDVTAGEEAIVVEGALQGGLGPAEVIASFLDHANCLAQGGVRDSGVRVDQLVFLWVTGSHSEVPAAFGEQCVGVGGGEQGAGLGQGGQEEEAEVGEHDRICGWEWEVCVWECE